MNVFLGLVCVKLFDRAGAALSNPLFGASAGCLDVVLLEEVVKRGAGDSQQLSGSGDVAFGHSKGAQYGGALSILSDMA